MRRQSPRFPIHALVVNLMARTGISVPVCIAALAAVVSWAVFAAPGVAQEGAASERAALEATCQDVLDALPRRVVEIRLV